MWSSLVSDKNFLLYFPDCFLKRTPPSEYFWKIYSVVKKKEFASLIEKRLSEYKTKTKVAEENLNLTEEAMKIFNKTNLSSNLDLLRFIKSEKI